MKSIDSYLKQAVEAGASDIHLIGGEFPTMRVSGDLSPIEEISSSASCTICSGRISPFWNFDAKRLTTR